MLVTAGTGAGFLLAAMLMAGGGTAAPSADEDRAAAPAVSGDPGAAAPGAGVLAQGDAGPEVAELQRRLSRIPDVYPGGAADGRYGRELAEAVARYQLWYGIRGDEEGVYGDDTRIDLEARTAG